MRPIQNRRLPSCRFAPLPDGCQPRSRPRSMSQIANTWAQPEITRTDQASSRYGARCHIG